MAIHLESLRIPVRMRRPASAREALGLSPLMEARWANAPCVESVHSLPHVQNHLSSFRGDQPQSGHRMCGPDGSRTFPSSCSGSMVGVSGFGLILYAHAGQRRRNFSSSPDLGLCPGLCPEWCTRHGDINGEGWMVRRCLQPLRKCGHSCAVIGNCSAVVGTNTTGDWRCAISPVGPKVCASASKSPELIQSPSFSTSLTVPRNTLCIP